MSDPPASRRDPAGQHVWLARRRIAALVQAAVVLFLPFARVGGESVLRFDIPTLTLHAFGAAVGVDGFSVVLLGIVLFLIVAIGTTAILGRGWCGWSCPQTAMPLLAEWTSSLFPKKARRVAVPIVLTLLSAGISFALLGYFVPPVEAARNLFRSPILSAFFLSLLGFHLLMLMALGPRFCRTICPYAMLQMVLFDDETLVIAYDKERDAACLRDELCVRVCPVGIDIRKGLQRECIACAECVDACVRVTTPRRIAPFVAYRGRLLRRRSAAWAAAATVAGIALAAAVAFRPPVEFAVQWVESIRPSGVDRYVYAIRNNTGRPLELALDAEGNAMLLGDRRIAVSPRARVTGKVLARPAGRNDGSITFAVSGPGILIRKKAATQ